MIFPEIHLVKPLKHGGLPFSAVRSNVLSMTSTSSFHHNQEKTVEIPDGVRICNLCLFGSASSREEERNRQPWAAPMLAVMLAAVARRSATQGRFLIEIRQHHQFFPHILQTHQAFLVFIPPKAVTSNSSKYAPPSTHRKSFGAT